MTIDVLAARGRRARAEHPNTLEPWGIAAALLVVGACTFAGCSLLVDSGG